MKKSDSKLINQFINYNSDLPLESEFGVKVSFKEILDGYFNFLVRGNKWSYFRHMRNYIPYNIYSTLLCATPHAVAPLRPYLTRINISVQL